MTWLGAYLRAGVIILGVVGILAATWAVDFFLGHIALAVLITVIILGFLWVGIAGGLMEADRSRRRGDGR